MRSTVKYQAGNPFKDVDLSKMWNSRKKKSKSFLVRKWRNKNDDDSMSEDSVSS